MTQLTNYLRILLIVLSLNGFLFAATYYVDATNGNDSNSGLSEDSAWRTINKVNNTNLQPGDIVLFKRGERYKGYSLKPSNSGNASNPIKFGAYGNGNRPIIDGEATRNCVEASNKNYLTYENLHLYNGDRRCFLMNNCNNITISNCIADGNHKSFQVAYLHGDNYHLINSTFKNAGTEHGVYMDGGDNCIVEYCTFTDNRMNGLKFNVGWTGEHADSPIVRYNWFENNETAIHDQSTSNAKIYYNVIIMRSNAWSTGISLSYEGGYGNYAPRNAEIYNNTFYNYDPNGSDNSMIYVYGNSNITGHIVKNNVFYNHHSTYGFTVYVSSGAGSISFNNNLYYKKDNGTNIWHWKGNTINSFNEWKNASNSDANSKIGNPNFKNPDNYEFEIESGSEAIDLGVDIGVNKDIQGTTINGNPDAGAYEAEGSSASIGVQVSTKIILTGSFQNGSQQTDLRAKSYIPTNQPFNMSPWNYNGTESASNLPNDIVDWVLLEIRESTSASSVIQRRAALLKSNGYVVDTDGSSPVYFDDVEEGNYYLVVKHRNHLAVMSANKLSLSDVTFFYDFTTGLDQAYGTNPMTDVGNGSYGLIPGDANGDGIISDDDIMNVWLDQFLNSKDDYQNGDLNLDGAVTSFDNNGIWLRHKNESTSVPN